MGWEVYRRQVKRRQEVGFPGEIVNCWGNLTTMQGKGSSNTPSRAMLQKPELSISTGEPPGSFDPLDCNKKR